MKKSSLIKIIAAAAALCITVSMFAGCSKNNGSTESETTTSAAVSETTVDTEIEETPIYETRAVEEGDVYAINKFTVDPLPANYELAIQSQENQGKIYLNGSSQIVVMATNYKEDFQALDTYADTACASIRMNNMLQQCDTDFEEPEHTTVAGFDAVKYDFLVTQNQFIKENPDDEGDGVKTPVDYFKSRIYYFYSDNDVFYVWFETKQEDWDANIGGFEEFVANIKIDENAVNQETTEETAAESTEEAAEETESETSAE